MEEENVNVNINDAEGEIIDAQEPIEESFYEKEYKLTQQKLEKEKEIRGWEREKRKELQNKVGELESSNEEKIAELVKQKVAETIDPYVKTLHDSQLSTAVSSLTDDPYKQKLIKEAYDNKIKLSGNLEEDLLLASAIVDGNINKKYGEEQTKADYAKRYAAQGITSKGVSKEVQPPDNISAEGKQFLDLLNKKLKR
jgi:hypothetical protein